MAGEVGIIESMGQSAIGLVVLIIAVLILVGIVVAITLAIINTRKYKQFTVVIWQRDGFGQFIQKYDEGGIFVDKKTGNKRLFLKNAGVGLTPDNIPYLPTSKGSKFIYLLQTGLKNFKFLKPNISGDFINFTVSEEDVNWALNDFDAVKKRFNSNWLQQYLPFIILGFTIMVMLVMFVYIFNKLPLFLDIAKEMKNVAELLVQARTGTTIIP
jgi:maltodextrin utilization protein YvdJ